MQTGSVFGSRGRVAPGSTAATFGNNAGELQEPLQKHRHGKSEVCLSAECFIRVCLLIILILWWDLVCILKIK